MCYEKSRIRLEIVQAGPRCGCHDWPFLFLLVMSELDKLEDVIFHNLKRKKMCARTPVHYKTNFFVFDMQYSVPVIQNYLAQLPTYNDLPAIHYILSKAYILILEATGMTAFAGF